MGFPVGFPAFPSYQNPLLTHPALPGAMPGAMLPGAMLPGAMPPGLPTAPGTLPGDGVMALGEFKPPRKLNWCLN